MVSSIREQFEKEWIAHSDDFLGVYFDNAKTFLDSAAFQNSLSQLSNPTISNLISDLNNNILCSSAGVGISLVVVDKIRRLYGQVAISLISIQTTPEIGYECPAKLHPGDSERITQIQKLMANKYYNDAVRVAITIRTPLVRANWINLASYGDNQPTSIRTVKFCDLAVSEAPSPVTTPAIHKEPPPAKQLDDHNPFAQFASIQRMAQNSSNSSSSRRPPAEPDTAPSRADTVAPAQRSSEDISKTEAEKSQKAEEVTQVEINVDLVTVITGKHMIDTEKRGFIAGLTGKDADAVLAKAVTVLITRNQMADADMAKDLLEHPTKKQAAIEQIQKARALIEFCQLFEMMYIPTGEASVARKSVIKVFAIPNDTIFTDRLYDAAIYFKSNRNMPAAIKACALLEGTAKYESCRKQLDTAMSTTSSRVAPPVEPQSRTAFSYTLPSASARTSPAKHSTSTSSSSSSSSSQPSTTSSSSSSASLSFSPVDPQIMYLINAKRWDEADTLINRLPSSQRGEYYKYFPK